MIPETLQLSPSVKCIKKDSYKGCFFFFPPAAFETEKNKNKIKINKIKWGQGERKEKNREKNPESY